MRARLACNALSLGTLRAEKLYLSDSGRKSLLGAGSGRIQSSSSRLARRRAGSLFIILGIGLRLVFGGQFFKPFSRQGIDGPTGEAAAPVGLVSGLKRLRHRTLTQQGGSPLWALSCRRQRVVAGNGRMLTPVCSVGDSIVRLFRGRVPSVARLLARRFTSAAATLSTSDSPSCRRRSEAGQPSSRPRCAPHRASSFALFPKPRRLAPANRACPMFALCPSSKCLAAKLRRKFVQCRSGRRQCR